MNNNDFAILHNIDGKQFLVDTTYNHDTDEFELTMKFWFEFVNGYTYATLKWKKECDFEKTFNELKSIEGANRWLNAIMGQFTNGEESE